MPVGPGKYDHLASQAREAADARAVLLMIIGGEQGGGFSFQSYDPELILTLPAILRNMADQIERDVSSVPGST
jgi:hypothetical protein